MTGATSNPTIFAKAITGSDLYDDQLRRLVASGRAGSHGSCSSRLRSKTSRDAARLLRPEYDRSGGGDGFISFECTPDLADRHRRDHRTGHRPLAATRPAQRDDQGPGDGGGAASDRGADAPRRQRQHHPAVLRRTLRRGDRCLRPRARGQGEWRRVRRRSQFGRVILSVSGSTPRSTPNCRRARRYAARSRRERASGVPALPDDVRGRAVEPAGEPRRQIASDRYGRVRGPRIPSTQIFCMCRS